MCLFEEKKRKQREQSWRAAGVSSVGWEENQNGNTLGPRWRSSYTLLVYILHRATNGAESHPLHNQGWGGVAALQCFSPLVVMGQLVFITVRMALSFSPLWQNIPTAGIIHI